MMLGVGMALLAMAGTAGTAQQGLLLVIEKGEESLAVIDPATGKVVTSIHENGVTGHEVAAGPTGWLAYVPIYGDSGVGKPGSNGRNMVVIDLSAREVVASLDFGHEVRPHQPVFGPKDGLLYVTTELDNTVTVIEPKTLKIVGTIPTGQAESHMLAISHDGRRGYTANVGPGTVSVLDMEARKTVKIIPVAPSTQRISVSMDDKWVFTADQTKPRLAVIDTATNTVKTWIALDAVGYGSAPTLDGKSLLVALPGANKVAVVDLKTMKQVRTIEVAAGPQAVLMNPNGKTAYVSCDGAQKVSEIDLATGKVTREMATGKGTDGMAWAAAR
jgi:YVTN family beta-propeller protein